jgi:hypothetical protein
VFCRFSFLTLRGTKIVASITRSYARRKKYRLRVSNIRRRRKSMFVGGDILRVRVNEFTAPFWSRL